MNSWFVRIHFCFFVYIFQFICVTIDSCILHEERKIKMNNNKEFLATEPIGKLLLRLAIPTLAAQMINMLYNIIDRIYIGHIPGSGALALTGVGVCMPLIMIISAFAALVGNGGAPRASILMGKKDLDSAENILGNCFTMQIIISVILTLIMFYGNRTFLMAFGASEAFMALNKTYGMKEIACHAFFADLVHLIQNDKDGIVAFFRKTAACCHGF